jgi:glucose-1-phosphatase
MSTPGLSCCLLDLGKVLLDFDLSRLGRCVHTLTGVTPEQLRAAALADDLAIRYESGKVSDAEFHEQICRRIGRPLTWDQFVNAWNSIFLPDSILPDHLIDRLTTSLDVWIISNTNPLHFRFIRRNYAFLRNVKGCILSYEVGYLKPDRRIFLHAVAVTGVEPARTVFIDDQEANVEAARLLGFNALHFVGAAQLEQQLRSLRVI